MLAVKAAHTSLIDKINTKELFELAPIQQDKKLEIRYSKNVDFNDATALEFLTAYSKYPYDADLKNNFWLPNLIRPYILD